MTKHKLLYRISCQLMDKEAGESFEHTITESISISAHTFQRLLKQNLISFFDSSSKHLSHELAEIHYSLAQGKITVTTHSYYLLADFLTSAELYRIHLYLKPYCTIRGKSI